MLVRFLKNKLKKLSNKVNKTLDPSKMVQNAMLTAMGMKKKSKLQILLEKIMGFFYAINSRILRVADRITLFYRNNIEGVPRIVWAFFKFFFKVFILGSITKFWHFLVAFYKKDRKRAIIYFILLYIIYKAICFACYRISLMFVEHKNNMVVMVREVKPERIEKDVNCDGYIESENNLNYQAEVRGTIEKIHVKEKQMVKRGQLLMELDSKFTANSYISAKSILESKRLQYNAIKKLQQEGLESIGNLKAMQADLESANSNFESAKKAYNGLKIYAPFDGFIDNINKKEKAQINPGEPLFTLERTNATQVKCDIQNISTDEIAVDDFVDVYVGGYEVAHGQIAVIGNSIDVYTGSRTILINRIDSIKGYEEAVKPGISVMIKVKAKSQHDVFKISSEALETTPTGAFMVKVLKPEDGSISTKNIWVYSENDGINYVYGLEDKDMVVERGHEFVNVGEKDIKYVAVDTDKTASQSTKTGFFQKIKNAKDYIYHTVPAVADKVAQFILHIPEFSKFFINSIKNDASILIGKVKSWF